MRLELVTRAVLPGTRDEVRRRVWRTKAEMARMVRLGGREVNLRSMLRGEEMVKV
jgi:hypothetical protein